MIDEYREEDLIVSKDGGMKYSKNKPRMELLPMEAIREVAKVMSFGAKKYAPNNWRGVEIQHYIGALLRHLATYMEGEEIIDEDSGLPTLAHLACDALFILDLHLKGKEFKIT